MTSDLPVPSPRITYQRTSQGAPPLDIPAEPLGWLTQRLLGALRAPRTAMRVTMSTKFAQRAAKRSRGGVS